MSFVNDNTKKIWKKKIQCKAIYVTDLYAGPFF